MPFDTPFSSSALLSLEECSEVYFRTNQYGAVRDALCMYCGFNVDKLSSWAAAFNFTQLCSGCQQKSLHDWSRHFFFWMKQQDRSQDPKNFFNADTTSKATTAANSRGNAESFYNAASGFNRKGE